MWKGILRRGGSVKSFCEGTNAVSRLLRVVEGSDDVAYRSSEAGEFPDDDALIVARGVRALGELRALRGQQLVRLLSLR